MTITSKKLLVLVLLISTFGLFAQEIIVRRCCTDAYSAENGFFAGPDRAWREDNITPENFTISRRTEDRPLSFPDLSEQPQTAGFELSIYTSPK